MADFDVRNIDIKDWDVFKNNNIEIKTLLERCSVNVANMVTNNTTLISTMPSIDAELSNLKTVTLSNKSLLLSDDYQQMNTYINDMNQELLSRSLKVVSCINFAELGIYDYDTADEKTLSAFNSIMNDLYDYNILWIASNTLQKVCPALSFLLGYGAEMKYGENKDFCVGDGVQSLFKDSISSLVENEYKSIWANTGVGTVAVVCYELFNNMNKYNIDPSNPDNWTQVDKRRLFANTSASAINYAEWSLISGSIFQSIKAETELIGLAEGSATLITLESGGLFAGAMVAAMYAYPTAKILKSIVDSYTGDVVAEQFSTENGKEYIITKNGEGITGTYNDILKKVYDSNKTSTIEVDGNLYSKEIIYENNWAEYASEVNGKTIVNEYEAENFNALLTKISNEANNAYEAKRMFDTAINEDTGLYHTYNELKYNYDYDITEWYKFKSTYET